jgi:hypothetical protein
MALLSKNAILTADDLKTQDIPVPEWGGEVRIKTLTGAERDQYEADSVKTNRGGKREVNMTNMRARLIAMCAVDEQGQLLFTRADVMKLGQKSAVALERVFDAAATMSGMSDDDVAELAGNFDGDQNESSTSD